MYVGGEYVRMRRVCSYEASVYACGEGRLDRMRCLVARDSAASCFVKRSKFMSCGASIVLVQGCGSNGRALA